MLAYLAKKGPVGAPHGDQVVGKQASQYCHDHQRHWNRNDGRHNP